MTTIAVVTAWRNHLELAPDYFNAVETANPDQLVIVDDASDPPLGFATTRLDEQGGFCTANNAGLALVETDAVVMLNNDVVMVRDTWLEEIRSRVEPGVILAPLRFDPHGSVDDVQYPYGDGWCLAAMTADLRAIGGWDEAYDQAGPAYFSDNALAFQARMHGMVIREIRPGVRHLGGRTGGQDQVLFQLALNANQTVFADRVRADLKIDDPAWRWVGAQ